MELAMITMRQVSMMALMMAIGWSLFKVGKLDRRGSEALTNVLLYVVLPCMIFNSFIREKTAETTQKLMLSLPICAGAIAISVLVARLLLKKHPTSNSGAAFSNAGFFGLPLIRSVLGNDAVTYVAFYILFLNALQWTMGVAIISGDKKDMAPKKVITNPAVIASAFGILYYFSGLKLPSVILDTISGFSSMSAQLSMLILGTFLARTKLHTIFTDGLLYWTASVRLLVIPVITVLLLALLPPDMNEIKLAVAMVSAAPIGGNTAAFAEMVGKDAPYASKFVCLSTILCILTMPFIVWFAQTLF